MVASTTPLLATIMPFLPALLIAGALLAAAFFWVVASLTEARAWGKFILGFVLGALYALWVLAIITTATL